MTAQMEQVVRRHRTARRPLAALAGFAGFVVTVAVYFGVTKAGIGVLALPVVMLVMIPLLILGASLVTRGIPETPGAHSSFVLLAPASFYIVFFVAPLILLAVYSFSSQSGFGQISFGLSFAAYQSALQDAYIKAFLASLGYALLGTVATLIVGFPFAYWLTRHAPPSQRQLLVALVMVPFWTSFLIRAYAMVAILSENSALATWLRSIGLIEGDLGLLNQPGGVFIGLVYGYLPLCVLPLYSTLERMDWTLVQAASDLGANKMSAFLQITLPIVMPGAATAGLLVFIPMAGEYIIPGVLGGGQVQFVGNIIERAFIGQQNYPFGAAVGMLVMLCLSLVMMAYVRSSFRSERRLDV